MALVNKNSNLSSKITKKYYEDIATQQKSIIEKDFKANGSTLIPFRFEKYDPNSTRDIRRPQTRSSVVDTTNQQFPDPPDLGAFSNAFSNAFDIYE